MEAKSYVSVIIPVYNSEKYLARCLDSILSQDYKQLEVLLIDDGSVDGSPDIADKYAGMDNRVRHVVVPHGGVSIARNTGLSMASGDYIMFVDADDWISAGIIGRMVATMEKTAADMVTCEIKHKAGMNEAAPAYQEGYTTCSQAEYIKIFFRIGSNQYVHYPVAKLYKKTLLPNPLYPPKIRIGEDVLGTYRAISTAQKIVRLNEIGYFYFASPESATATFGEKDFDLLAVWDMMVEEAKGREPDEAHAVLDRKRMDFCLLFRLVTEVPPKERKQKYAEQEKQLKKDLKRSEKELLHGPIVWSRKVLIFLLCHFYPCMSLAGHMYMKLKQHR